MGVCYIVGAGDFYGDLSPRDGDLLVAADGGYEKIAALGYTPSFLIGDFDSISDMPSGIKTLRYPVEKDETDMQLAYNYGASLGYTEFVIYGGVGGRDDHTFANYCLLLHIKNQGHNAKMIGNGTEISIVKNEKIEIFGKEGEGVSVFAFGSELAEGVTVRGLKYEASDITLRADFALGVSNSFLALGRGEIEVKRGALLLIREAFPRR